MKFLKNGRGFRRVEMLSCENEPRMERLVQESSAIGDYEHSMDVPGSSFLWIGEHHHLDREQVLMLIKVLEFWLAHKRLPPWEFKEPWGIDQPLTKREADWAADYHDNWDSGKLFMLLIEPELLAAEAHRLERHLGLERFSISLESLRRATIAALNMREFDIDCYSQMEVEE